MPLPEVCVVYLLRDGTDGREVLLGRKKTGLGRGKTVAPGGKLHAGESPADAARREVLEETGLRVTALRAAGAIDYFFPARPAWSQRSHVFVSDQWEGSVVESEELDARWMPVTEVPFERMWDDARRWLPAVLGGGLVDMSFTFGEDLTAVVS
jgi:8-oxo-dGTP diphosphatase